MQPALNRRAAGQRDRYNAHVDLLSQRVVRQLAIASRKALPQHTAQPLSIPQTNALYLARFMAVGIVRDAVFDVLKHRLIQLPDHAANLPIVRSLRQQLGEHHRLYGMFIGLMVFNALQSCSLHGFPHQIDQ